LRLVRNRRGSPTAAMNVAAQIRFTPGTLISRRISDHSSACWAISRSTAAISESRNSIWRTPASTDSRSSTGSSRPASQRRPLTPNRSEHGGLPCSRRCRTAWISFLARERECTSCSRRASRSRSTRQRSSGLHTDSNSPDHNNLANVRASSRSVLARARVIRCRPGRPPRPGPRAPPGSARAPSSCPSPPTPPDPIPPGSAPATPAHRAWRARDQPSEPRRPRRSRPRRSHGEHPGRSLALPTCSTPSSPHTRRGRHRTGEPAGQRHRPIRAPGTIQASRRGGRTKSTGSKPIAHTGLPACVLPTKPLSRITRRYGRTRTEPPTSIFMPRGGAAGPGCGSRSPLP
jgi:hypothetical protein